MRALEALKKTDIWDTRFDLPTVPKHNNPHIYIAYMFLLCSRKDEMDYRRLYFAVYDKFFSGCQKEKGLFYRWPGGGGGETSHDEIMGAAWMRPGIAREIIDYLTEKDGQYGVTEQETYNERRNMFRFFWLMPYLRACADYRVSLISQFVWSFHVVLSAVKFDGQGSGVLKIWLMSDKMKSLPICAIAVVFWKYWMKKKHGITLKTIFQKYYFTEYPVLADIAEEF